MPPGKKYYPTDIICLSAGSFTGVHFTFPLSMGFIAHIPKQNYLIVVDILPNRAKMLMPNIYSGRDKINI